MAASWLAAVSSSVAMMKATQEACDPELQSKTEQHATTTLMHQLQQVSSLKPEDIAEFGKILKEAQLPSGWGKDLMRAAVQRKLDLSLEAKPEKSGERQGQSCLWTQNYLPERLWLTLMEPSTPMPIGLRSLDSRAVTMGIFYGDEAFHAHLVGLAALTKKAETEKPRVFQWLDESKANVSNVRPKNLDKTTLCWQFPSDPQAFRKTSLRWYGRCFTYEPPIECPINATHAMMYLKSIPQRKTFGTSPTKLERRSPLDTGSALVSWRGGPPRQGSALSASGSAADASTRGASGSADERARGSADARRPGSADAETPRFDTDKEHDLALRLGSVVLRAVRKGSFGPNEFEDIACVTGQKIKRDICFGSPIQGRQPIALRDREDRPTVERQAHPTASPANPTSSKRTEASVDAIDADIENLLGGEGLRGSEPMKKEGA